MAARSTKPAAEVEPEEDFEEELVETETDEDIEVEDELDDLELEEVEDADEDEAEEVEEAPQKRGRKTTKKAAAPKKKPANAVEFGTAELLAHIESETGKKYDGRQLRVLLRKMKAAGELPGEAADGKRYSFTGPTDEKVVAIIQRVKAGEVDDATKAALDKLKADAEAKRKAKKEAREKAEAEAAAAEESEVEADEDDVEEEAPAPKPATRRRAPAKKATTRRAPARKKSTDVAEDEDGDDEE